MVDDGLAEVTLLFQLFEAGVIGAPAKNGSNVLLSTDSLSPNQLWFHSTNREGAGGKIVIVDSTTDADLQPAGSGINARMDNQVYACHFPFYYDGAMHTDCACGLTFSVPWCSLGPDARAGKIGTCIDTGSSSTDPTCTGGAGASAGVLQSGTVDDVFHSSTGSSSENSGSSSATIVAAVVPAIVLLVIIVVVVAVVRQRRQSQARYVAPLPRLD